MPKLTELDRYSIGVGDRFGQQAEPQLQACLLARAHGIRVTPVWNKSNREHLWIGSGPADTRAAAEAAVRRLSWRGPYHVDADHVTLATVERFLADCDFFTLDVADRIGERADNEAVSAFLRRHPELTAGVVVPRLEQPLQFSATPLERTACRYLSAVREAGRIYQRIAASKGEEAFVVEVSMDETDQPQTPADLLLILAALADEGVPLQTIAPRFSGRFNKGIDYLGDVEQFGREFKADLAVVEFASKQYGLPRSLKLSVHSGSDKFSLYPIMRRYLQTSGAGLHLKTAGTTWLEEVAALAESGGDALILCKQIYVQALDRLDELCAPYAAVIAIDRAMLPKAEQVSRWDPQQFVAALRHDPRNPGFNPHFRQLLHVGYKIAAEMGDRYLAAIKDHQEAIGRRVTDNLYRRHILPLFPQS